MKIDRLLSIIMMLLDKQIISANTLANKFEVSKRTIYRDIETLQYAGFPIISYPGVNGGFGLLDTFKIHSFTFNDYEKQMILNALQVQEQLLPFQETNPDIHKKLQAIQDIPIQKANMTLTSATLHNPIVEKQTNVKLKELYAALREHHKVNISYITANGDFSHRIILPLELTLQNGSWYLKAYCEVRNDIRLFKLTRIRKMEVLPITFLMDIPLDEVKDDSQIEIQLSFAKKSLGKLYDFFLDNQMKIVEDTVIVTFLYSKTHNIIPFLLMFGNQVSVLSPESLREKHITSIKEMQNIY